MTWIALAGLLLIAMVGLGLDTAQGLLVGHQLQNAADAASLAGALVVKANVVLGTRDRADQLALANKAAGEPVQLSRNEANDPEGDIVLGRYDRQLRTFNPNPTPSVMNAVKVVARRTQGSPGGPLPTLFGRSFGVNTVGVSRSAIAVSAGTTGAGMLVLCPDCECALKFGGTGDLVLQSDFGWTGNTAIQVKIGRAHV